MYFQKGPIKTMEAGVAYTWLQQQLHTQNISNYDTPNYKAKGVRFAETLKRARDADGNRTYRSVLSMQVVEHDDTTVRPDGNNVDMDAESLSLYKAYAHYSLLLDKISSEFRNYNYVLNNGPR